MTFADRLGGEEEVTLLEGSVGAVTVGHGKEEMGEDGGWEEGGGYRSSLRANSSNL